MTGGAGSGRNPDSALQARVDRLLDALERRGMLARAEVDARLERFLAAATPANGARVVARAWTDPGFAGRLFADATTAVAELGYSLGHQREMRLRAVANTPTVHNVVVCTLCSCYPIALLGPPPGWYRSEAYRARVVRAPRAVLAELGLQLPEGVEVRVWDSTADCRYLVVPQRPAETWGSDEAALATLVTRDCLVGAAVCVPTRTES